MSPASTETIGPLRPPQHRRSLPFDRDSKGAIVTPEAFLQAFSDLADNELHTMRRNARLAQWPTDEDFYLSLAKQLFRGDRLDWERRQRFVSLLREMMYTDARSLRALMHIAHTAAEDPENYDANGVNALAAIWCYLNVHGPGDRKHLLEDLQRLALTPELSNNATNCVKLLS